MEKTITTPVVKGLLISLVLIVIGLGIYFGGLMQNKSVGFLQYIVLIGGVIWGCIIYANQMEHNVTYGNVFAHGFKITAVITVIMIVYTVLALTFLFPEMKDIALQQARENMEKSGNITDEQIDKALGLTSKFFTTFAIAGILVGFLVIGLISSLIGAAVAKKNPQNPFQQA